ncbi:MAG TPA: hypothetical protein VEV85_19185 [Bryobacteraceae bacterium]|nr:hypothetical protein [Bryobacteraceae bacterium]
MIELVVPGFAFARTGTETVKSGNCGNWPMPADEEEKCTSRCSRFTLA